MVAIAGSLWFVKLLFLLCLAILWFILPFAIFGTKKRLDTLIEEAQKTNSLLAKIERNLSSTADDEGFSAFKRD